MKSGYLKGNLYNIDIQKFKHDKLLRTSLTTIGIVILVNFFQKLKFKD